MTLAERYRTASPRAQLVLWASLGVLVLALLIAGYMLFIRRPYDVLFNNLRTLDAATIVAQLEKDKIPYRLDDQGTTILVPADTVDQTRLSIMSADLPLKGMVGFELFNKSDMGLTEFAQRINYQRALQGELARTIMTLEAVDAARVHLSLPEQTVFREDRRLPRASVTIQTRPGKVMTASAVKGVQRLVAAAVPDMAVGDVVILDQAGEEVSGASFSPQSIAGADYADEGVESFYAAKISDALAREFPNASATVQVWADVDANRATTAAAAPAASGATVRPYRLRISVVVASQVTPDERQAIRNAVVSLSGLDGAQGDILAVSSDLAAPSAAASPIIAAPPPPTAKAVPAGSGPSSGFALMISSILAVLVILFGIAFLLTRRPPAGRTLSDDERDAMSRDLHRLLDQRMADGAAA